MDIWMEFFRNPAAVARYAEGPPRFTPGFADMQYMTSILLAERARSDDEILVLGAGGGLELELFARMQPRWRTVGVDPAAAMLDQARNLLRPHANRVVLIEGYIDDAPAGPFGGGCCLLTLHFLDRPERLRTLQEIHRRLAPNAAFVVAHASFPQAEPGRALWLNRYAAFAIAKGVEVQMANSARDIVAANLQPLDPADDEAVLREAGFGGVEIFYAGFSWRGWVCYA